MKKIILFTKQAAALALLIFYLVFIWFKNILSVEKMEEEYC
jgi:hypothetical protein